MDQPVMWQAVNASQEKRPGGEAVLERISEMMFVNAVRRHAERLPEESTGWLAGLRDRQVGRALWAAYGVRKTGARSLSRDLDPDRADFDKFSRERRAADLADLSLNRFGLTRGGGFGGRCERVQHGQQTLYQ